MKHTVLIIAPFGTPHPGRTVGLGANHDLTNLRALYLANNELSGEISAELGNLTNLEELYLAGNELRGCLPAAWRNVAQNDLANLGLPFCAASSATDAVTDREAHVALYPATEPGKPPADNENKKFGKPNPAHRAKVAS